MKHRLAAWILALAGLTGIAPQAARAVDQSDLMPVDQAYVLTAKAISRNRIELHWQIAPGYYLYRHRTSVQSLDPAFKADALQLPDGEKHTDEFFGKVETYRGSLTAVQTGTAAGGMDAVNLKVKYQGCADIGVCYPPQTRTITVALPVDESGSSSLASDPAKVADPLAALGGNRGASLSPAEALPEEQAFRFEAIANSSSELLVRLTPAPGYYLYRDKTSFELANADGMQLGAPRFPPGKPHSDEHFGDVMVYFEVAEIPLPVLRKNSAASTITLRAHFQGCQMDGICYPPMTREIDLSLPAGAGSTAAPAATGAVENPGLWLSLLGALFGGLILNLMPCVLPVLSFKALGLAESSRSHAHARAHALWYTAGVLLSFAAVGALVLGLRGAGQALGWGFQLQQPGVVSALVMLMVVIGLNLSGLFEVGGSWVGAGQSLTQKSGATGDFFTGVLAVVVASPCTVPYMAGALAYAFTAPAASAMLIFLALGLGMALPFLLIGFVPALASRLPKPGAWMDTLRHWLALPMYLTAVWLLWVFGKQRGMDSVAVLLAAAVVLALGLWWMEKQRYGESRGQKIFAIALIAISLAGTVVAARLPSTAGAQAPTDGAVKWTAAAMAEARAAGKPVFVDMTADWCITCKVNEKAVLHTDAFKALLARTGTVYMVGDWTDQNEEISAFLDEFHAPGVPLYVVYPAGGGEGHKLPQLLSERIMREALEPGATP